MLMFDGNLCLNYAEVMNDEHKALAEYLESRLKAQSKDLYTYMDRRFDEIKSDFKEVHNRIDRLVMHIDRKNDDQDEQLDNHDSRILALESDCRILTS